MDERKGKRMGKIAKKGRIPRCNGLLALHAAYFSLALTHRSHFYPTPVAV